MKKKKFVMRDCVYERVCNELQFSFNFAIVFLFVFGHALGWPFLVLQLVAACAACDALF